MLVLTQVVEVTATLLWDVLLVEVLMVIIMFSLDMRQELPAGLDSSENTIIGNCAGCCTSGDRNTFLGHLAGNTTTSGCCNVAIGYDVELPTTTGNDQMAIGSGTNRWIYW